MTILSPQQLAYLREWKKSGNEPRDQVSVAWWYEANGFATKDTDGNLTLSLATLNLLALYELAELGCDVAETFDAGGLPIANMQSLRKRRKELMSE